MGSALGAAMKATSTGVRPLAMSLGRPPWVRNSTGLSSSPREISRPRPAAM